MSSIKLAIVGVGKIVRDQHIPAIAANPSFQLVAAASRNGTIDGIANFKSIDVMLEMVKEVDAVSLCMPPQYRYEAAFKALSAGKHVFLEKPPGATLSEVHDLAALAKSKNVSLFASWHSRYAPGVEAGKDLSGRHDIEKPQGYLERRCAPLAPQPGMDLAGRRSGRV